MQSRTRAEVPTRKDESHQRIVRAAARLFRKDGQSSTGIDRVMAVAGLTHGGFYAHFRDKTVLFVEAIEHAFDEAESNLLSRGLEDLRGQAYVEAATARYVTAVHKNRPADGCAIPSLGAEAARSPANVRKAFTARVEQITARIAARLDGPDADLRALQLLSFWAGTLLVARNLSEKRAATLIAGARDAALRIYR